MASNYACLSQIDPPWIHIDLLSDLDHIMIPSYQYCQGDNNCVLRVIRGRVVCNTSLLMNEFAAAFQFPITDFGANWYALKDCLSCLDEWLPATKYIVYITEAELVLSEQTEEWKWFLLTLHEVCTYWSKPIADNGRFNRDSIPFHVLLKYDYGSLDKILRLVRQATDHFPGILVSGML